jgi:hypothetical protein
MLRFVVVWNEIVNLFRETDLLDDKEAAILQYDIRSMAKSLSRSSSRRASSAKRWILLCAWPRKARASRSCV